MSTITARLGLDKKEFDKSLADTEKNMKKWASSILPITAAAGAFAAATIEATKLAQAVKDGAEQLGVSTEEYQKLSFASKRSAGDMKFVQNALTNLDKLIGDSSSKFAEWGFSLAKANGETKTSVELFMELADAVKNNGEDSSSATAAADLLGGSFKKLLPLLKLGSEGIKQLGQDAERMGEVMSTETLDALDTAADRIDNLKTRLTIFAGTITGVVMSALDSLAGGLGTLLTEDGGEEAFKKLQKEAIDRINKRRPADDQASQSSGMGKYLNNPTSLPGFIAQTAKFAGLGKDASPFDSTAKGVSKELVEKEMRAILAERSARLKSATDRRKEIIGNSEAEKNASLKTKALEETNRQVAKLYADAKKKEITDIATLEKMVAAERIKASDISRTRDERVTAAKQLLEIEQRIKTIKEKANADAKSNVDLVSKRDGLQAKATDLKQGFADRGKLTLQELVQGSRSGNIRGSAGFEGTKAEKILGLESEAEQARLKGDSSRFEALQAEAGGLRKELDPNLVKSGETKTPADEFKQALSTVESELANINTALNGKFVAQ